MVTNIHLRRNTMPCRVDIPESERIASHNQRWLQLADEMTHEMDVLRELLLSDPDSVGEGKKNSFKQSLDNFLRLDFETNKSGVRERIFNEATQIITVFNRPDLAETLLLDDQVKHRKEDLMRVITYFANKKDLDTIKRVINVDLTKPLEPQLGFDPDDYS